MHGKPQRRGVAFEDRGVICHASGQGSGGTEAGRREADEPLIALALIHLLIHYLFLHSSTEKILCIQALC